MVNKSTHHNGQNCLRFSHGNESADDVKPLAKLAHSVRVFGRVCERFAAVSHVPPTTVTKDTFELIFRDFC